MIGNAPDEEYTDPHGECAAHIAQLETHIAVLREALKPFADIAEKIATEHPGWDHDEFYFVLRDGRQMPLQPFRCAKAVYDSTPASVSLDRIRREGAEAAAKVMDKNREQLREYIASIDPTTGDARRYALAIAEGRLLQIEQDLATLRALYPEVAPHQEKASNP